jgi:hypothetical protein
MKTAMTKTMTTVRVSGRLSLWQHDVLPLALAGGDA